MHLRELSLITPNAQVQLGLGILHVVFLAKSAIVRRRGLSSGLSEFVADLNLGLCLLP